MEEAQEVKKQAGPSAYLGVDYDEFKPETYRCVFVRENNGQGGESNSPFSTGNFVKDLIQARRYLSTLVGVRLYELSSLHHFLTDLAVVGKETKNVKGS
jgi:hypothetical protein